MSPLNSNIAEPSAQSDLLPEKQAAKYLGISYVTLFRKRANKEIGFFRVGHRVIYSISRHLQPFLDSCEQKVQLTEGGK